MPRKALRPLSVLGMLAVLTVVIGRQSPVPQPADEQIASTVVRILERVHMAKPRIDDETGKKWCKNFLKDLDPQKYYFLKADVDEYNAQAPRSTTKSERETSRSPPTSSIATSSETTPGSPTS